MSELEKLYNTVLNYAEEVPFSNSDWQNRQAIVNDEKTGCRAFRHASLRIMNRIQALRECQYNISKTEIEVKILERKIAESTDELENELTRLEIDHKRSHMPYTRKLAKDAIREIESLWPVLESMGKISRKQFEEEEQLHYEAKHKIALPKKDDLFERITQGLVATLPNLEEEIKLLDVNTTSDLKVKLSSESRCRNVKTY